MLVVAVIGLAEHITGVAIGNQRQQGILVGLSRLVAGGVISHGYVNSHNTVIVVGSEVEVRTRDVFAVTDRHHGEIEDSESLPRAIIGDCGGLLTQKSYGLVRLNNPVANEGLSEIFFSRCRKCSGDVEPILIEEDLGIALGKLRHIVRGDHTSRAVVGREKIAPTRVDVQSVVLSVKVVDSRREVDRQSCCTLGRLTVNFVENHVIDRPDEIVGRVRNVESIDTDFSGENGEIAHIAVLLGVRIGAEAESLRQRPSDHGGDALGTIDELATEFGESGIHSTHLCQVDE